MEREFLQTAAVTLGTTLIWGCEQATDTPVGKLLDNKATGLQFVEQAVGKVVPSGTACEAGRQGEDIVFVGVRDLLDQGEFARKEVSMAKVVVSEALHKAVDTAIQLCGAKGYSKDLSLEWMYRYARLARLGDGASEIHKMVLSRALLAEGMDFWKW